MCWKSWLMAVQRCTLWRWWRHSLSCVLEQPLHTPQEPFDQWAWPGYSYQTKITQTSHWFFITFFTSLLILNCFIWNDTMGGKWLRNCPSLHVFCIGCLLPPPLQQLGVYVIDVTLPVNNSMWCWCSGSLLLGTDKAWVSGSNNKPISFLPSS